MPALQEILDRAEILANGAADDANASRLVDSDVTAYVIFPHAVRYVIRQMAKKKENLENLARDVAIEIAEGSGALPDSVLREYFDQSHLPIEEVVKICSGIPYPDYLRYRYDNQLCYFAFRNGRMHYSCEIGLLESGDLTSIVAATNSESLGTGGINWLGLDTFRPVDGRRVRLARSQDFLDAGFPIIDAFAQYADDDATLVFYGFPLSNNNLNDGQGIYSVFDDGPYVEQRALANVNTTLGSRTVTCAGANFTAADVGRRLQVTDGTVVVDAIIHSVTNTTTVDLRARAMATTAIGAGSVMYSPIVLNIPAIPDLPSNITDDVELSGRIVEDVIVAIAAVLRGQIPLPKLIEEGNPDK